MKDFKVEDFDLIQKGGDLEVVRDLEAKKQSILMRLTVERGSFIYDEFLGSRLKNLYRDKPSKRKEMAKLYVIEALEHEEDIVVDNVVVLQTQKKKISIIIYFTWNDTISSLEVEI